MKKLTYLFYIIFISTLITIGMTCYSMPSHLTSAPWYIGVLYPAIYGSIISFFIAVYLYYIYKRKLEVLLSGLLLLIQAIILFN